MSEFKDQGVLVAGATSGIGRATAIAFGQAGARVGILGRNQERAKQTAVEIEAAGGQALCLIADLGQPDEVREAVESFVSQAGPLKAAVNAAGADIENSLADYTMEEYAAVFDVNVRGLLLLMQCEIRTMREGDGGSIVNITSISARKEVPQNALYNASKSAASMLTRCAAMEEGPHNIRVNELAPGPVDTPMLRGFFEKAVAAGIPTGPEALNKVSPLGRIGSPTEIAEAILFLSSSKSAYLTGACLTADGGFSLGLRVS